MSVQPAPQQEAAKPVSASATPAPAQAATPEAVPAAAPAEAPAPSVEEKKSVVSRASGYVKNMINERTKFKEQEAAKAEQARQEEARKSQQQVIENYQRLKENAKKDPYAIAREFNLTNDDLIRANLGSYEAPAEEKTPEQIEKERVTALIEEHMAPIREKAAKYDAWIEEQQRNQKASEDVQERLLMEKIGVEIKTGDYPWVKHHGQEAANLVREILYDYWQKNGVSLPFSEACDIAETHYDEEMSSLVSSDAFKKKHTPKVVEKEPVKADTKEEKKDDTASTLSHRATQGASGLSPAPKVSKDDNRAFEELKRRKLANRK